jgi:hypothetical protein
MIFWGTEGKKEEGRTKKEEGRTKREVQGLV